VSLRPWLRAVLLLGLAAGTAGAGDGIDLDLWHQQLAADLGSEIGEVRQRRPAFGLFPTLGAAAGPPNWIAAQGALTVSFTDGRRFSLMAGYGIERGPQADGYFVTLGWGGVRPIPVATRQLAFHGKFLRYRRWDDNDRGVHHGLSIGTEHGVGFAALSFEVGAARSSDDHWLVVAQFGLKLARPFHIPLSSSSGESRD
jgi:hypothetical protein